MIINTSEIITIGAGHSGNVGARGCGKFEEVLTKELTVKLVAILKEKGYKAYDVSPTGNLTSSQNLSQEVANANKYNAKLHLCIHFNAYNSQAYGTEAWIYKGSAKGKTYADPILKAIVDLGYTNRGIKETTGLYVPKNTKNPCVLLEVCFIDSTKDMGNYNVDKTAKALFKAITGLDYIEEVQQPQTPSSGATTYYRVVADGVNIASYSDFKNASDEALKQMKACKGKIELVKVIK